MPDYPAIDYDYHVSLPSRDSLTPILVYVDSSIIQSVAGLLLSICATKPSDEHIDEIDDEKLRDTNELVRAAYTSVALDLLARRTPMPIHDEIITVLETGDRNFISEYDSETHTWTITLTLPNPEKGDKGDKGDIGNTGPIGPVGPQGVSGSDCSDSLLDNGDCEECDCE